MLQIVSYYSSNLSTHGELASWRPGIGFWCLGITCEQNLDIIVAISSSKRALTNYRI